MRRLFPILTVLALGLCWSDATAIAGPEVANARASKAGNDPSEENRSDATAGESVENKDLVEEQPVEDKPTEEHTSDAVEKSAESNATGRSTEKLADSTKGSSANSKTTKNSANSKKGSPANSKTTNSKTEKSADSQTRKSNSKTEKSADSKTEKSNSKKKKSNSKTKKSSSKNHKSASSKKSKSADSKTKKSKAAKAASKRKPGHRDCEYRTPIYEHKVEAGEHLGSIAGRYGVRRADIVGLNPSLQKNPDLIHPGQTLRVCPDIAPRRRVEKIHEVVKGESLGKIASHYGLTLREVIGLQDKKLRMQLEKNPDALWIGTKLKILAEEEELEVYKPPDEDQGRLPVGMKLGERKGVLIKRSHLAWGTKATIKAVEQAIRTYHRRKPGGPKVRVGDISKKGGGPLRGHLSHQRGIDVDVGIIHKGNKRNAERFTHATSENLDVARTWALLKAFIDTQKVRVIFLDYALQKRLYKYARTQGVSEDTLAELFQYPRGRGRASGIVRHWRSHRGHLHVRFRR